MKKQTKKRLLPRDPQFIASAVSVTPSLDQVRKTFSLPVSRGFKKEEREAVNLAFDSAGCFDTIYDSLAGHSADLGQLPMTSFMGYGALQQIQQNALIRACIQTVADDITAKWIKITGTDETSQDKIAELEEALKPYRLDEVFNEACATCGYMGGSFIFIDTGAEGEELKLPLHLNNRCAEIKKGSHIRFAVIDPVNCSPQLNNLSNPLKADYMKPKFWWVMGHEVHATRLIPIVDNPVSDLLKPSYNFLGIPQAQLLWDYVVHFNDSRNTANDLLKKTSLLVVQTDTQQIFDSPDGLRDFDLRMKALERYRDNNSVFVCDKTEEGVTNVQTGLAGGTDIVKQNLELISAINRTPAVKLLGISPSGFNATGESDIRNYHEAVMAKKRLRTHDIMRCLEAIQLATFGEIDPSISFEFELMDDEDKIAISTSNSARGQLLATLAGSQIISAEEARQAVKNDPDMGLDFLSDEAPDGMGMEPDETEGENPFASLLGNAENTEQTQETQPPRPEAQSNPSDRNERGNPQQIQPKIGEAK